MISSSWARGFEAAKAASKYAIAPRIGLKVGAALYAKSTLLSIGFNSYDVTHPNSHRNRVYTCNIHAEHRAIIKRQHYVNGNLIIYVWRERFDGTPGNCKPCLTCQLILKEAGVKRARFIDEFGKPKEMIL